MNNLKKSFEKVTNYHWPKVLGEVNDQYIKVAKILGEEIPWHNHDNSDELFYIVEGELLMEVEGESPFLMQTGDYYIVKKGVNHKVSSKAECKVMLFEAKETAHTGDVESKVTRSIHDQL